MSCQYDPQSYLMYLKTSINGGQKHILVEGKDDKYLINKLCNDFCCIHNQKATNKIIVDSAEFLIKVKGGTSCFSGNKDKVEFIAESVIEKPYFDGFIGFVDRELHAFEWDYELSSDLLDKLNKHDVSDRLVLSRGHSIENYIFDVSIFCDALELFSTISYATQSIDLFGATFESALRTACLIGLIATKAKVLKKVFSTIDYGLLDIDSTKQVTFKFDNWVQKLVSQNRISSEQEQDLRLHYRSYNNPVKNADISIIRWICHGHIGYEFLRALYERCIFDTCPSGQENGKDVSNAISWLSKEKLFQSLINAWVKKSLQNQCEYPEDIFKLLKII